MHTDDFDYHLPPELIAQTPVEPRDAARLLHLDRTTGAVSHRTFRDLLGLLQPGDLLVANESRVLPARLFGHKASGGKTEVLLLRERDAHTWEALVRGRGLGVGATLHFSAAGAATTATVVELLASGGRLLRFDQHLLPLLPLLGVMPLPPYIHAPLANPDRYQTVYSQTLGSAAAPTAGLHFTPALLDELTARGVGWATVTLHVGLDTFRPVQVEDVTQHQMHSEWFALPDDAAAAINRAKRDGRRVIAVGTTTARVLESVGQAQRPRQPGGWRDLVASQGNTTIFIYPPFEFEVLDGLITNFHLPKSTLMMLVSALAGREAIMAAYAAAITERYRFFSFGDAMLIV